MNKKNVITPRKISGFADYTEGQNYQLGEWLRKVESTFALFGFSKLIPRPLELRELLLTKGGIQKQIFGITRLPDDTTTELALPFDRTVPLAIWVAKHCNEIEFPYKRYDVGYSFRGERAQQGRFQGFFQCDVDIIGRDELNSKADAECIAVLFSVITELGIGNAYITINNIKLAQAILSAYEIADEKQKDLLGIIDSIPKVSIEQTTKEMRELCGLDDMQAQTLTKVFSYQGPIEKFISETGCINAPEIQKAREALQTVVETLSQYGVNQSALIFRPCIVRGLDYYSGVVFETFIQGKENFGSVASGGRYDNLASTFTKNQLPGFGGSIGLTRLFDLALKSELLNTSRKSEADFLICYRTEELLDKALELAKALRDMKLRTDVYTGKAGITKQLKYANSKGFPFAILVMDEATIVCKNLTTGEQNEFQDNTLFLNHVKFNRYESKPTLSV